ncbi:pentatricopeptide repeat-containing protein At5g27460 [Cryptomeria japonica]|uniref:pentatricopeptide repeat-containing protein At5g27460 n=1 Tax=Cryptomeria japonica TaxID=3369 RepID=UPI0025AD870E|nr:pentatricopeptide repeat-containing protein At5g27460 [Cryptomeria japonica]
MTSRFLLNGFKWFACQRTQTVLKPCSGFASRAGSSDLQATFIAERRKCLYNESRRILLPLWSRSFSSEVLVEENETSLSALKKLDRELRRDKYSEERVNKALQVLVEDGNKISKEQVLRLIRKFRKFRKHEAALQVSKWMLERKEFEHVSGDYALHMDLIANIHGVSHAEQYFESLPKNIRGLEVNSALLQCYVRKQLVEKAEEQFKRMEELGLARKAHCFNQIMTLYMATGQADKVLLQVKQMKKMNVLPDRKTYNLWLNACASVYDGIDEVEKIVDEIKTGGENNIHWSTYCTLANIYINADHVDKAEPVVKQAEKAISKGFGIAHESVITLYGALGNKEGVYRIWQSVKEAYKNPSFSNYESVLSSLVKVGDIRGAEKIFEEWESNNPVNCKLANILLDTYVKNSMLEKAEKLHDDISKKKCKLNCRSWEILTEGYLESKRMGKAVVTMKNALKKGISNGWQPKSQNIKLILNHFANNGNVEGAAEFIDRLRPFKCVTTEAYNLVLSTYVKAGKPAPNILKKMAQDKVKPDQETDRLLKLVNTEGLKVKP